MERLKYSDQAENPFIQFFVVTCGRNTGPTVIECLQSVYDQNIERNRIKHLVIDDASDDGTAQLISNWLKSNHDHNVTYIQNRFRKGGTANTREAFRRAPEGLILLELNADDWLPDSDVLGFLSKVYSDDEVWMTYNSFAYSNRTGHTDGRPYPAYIVRDKLYRDYAWVCQHLHTFRTALLKYLPDDIFLNPETGDYFSSADDRSIYWSLLELCGHHAIHLERITHIYNFHENTDLKTNPISSVKNAEIIRKMPRLEQLEKL